MNYSNCWVRYKKFDNADEVCKFIQHSCNITIISITESDKGFTVFYY